MPKTFELKFTKIADNLYSGSLSVEGQQMTFGVPKTKEEIYQFLFGGNEVPAPTPTPEAKAPERTTTAPVTETNLITKDGWRFAS